MRGSASSAMADVPKTCAATIAAKRTISGERRQIIAGLFADGRWGVESLRRGAVHYGAVEEAGVGFGGANRSYNEKARPYQGGSRLSILIGSPLPFRQLPRVDVAMHRLMQRNMSARLFGTFGWVGY